MSDKRNPPAIVLEGKNSAGHLQTDEASSQLADRYPDSPLTRSVLFGRPAPALTENIGPIPFKIFRPPTVTWGPSILFLHGAFGLTPNYYPLMHRLARSGYLVFAPLYFTSTGTVCAGPRAVHRHFFGWIGALIDSMFEMRSRADVDSSRIGILGISLGASLGLALGGQCSGIKAVVDFFGEVPAVSLVSILPPTLVVHGEADRHVPVAKILKLVHVLRQQNTPCQLSIYPGERHVLRPPAFQRAMREAIAFFDKYVKNE